ncbi:hypothetical protein [Pseudosporangium ferrugineum]|uniref:Uncharacterized protein n=1 Tax=Pseudosporangium ferrugineum TaxID=439699 RepID=A0A2T0SEF9_9ACTN|nr:hypothetical protein [Pseudosporangium ferrugineum]PRY31790.1 hypothetical protein CLV70_1021 [Pseudosporangium ferrugineum]
MNDPTHPLIHPDTMVNVVNHSRRAWWRPWWSGRESAAGTVSGLPVPSAIRVVDVQQLRALIEAAEGNGLGWHANDVVLRDGDLYVLLPYSFEQEPVRSWKCRVIALVEGMSTEVGKAKIIGYGRLDVSRDVFLKLPRASRKVERQLVHWLGGKAAAAVWKDVRSDQPTGSPPEQG